jgi:hypothetical protein
VLLLLASVGCESRVSSRDAERQKKLEKIFADRQAEGDRLRAREGYVKCIKLEDYFYECRPQAGIVCYGGTHSMSCLETDK